MSDRVHDARAVANYLIGKAPQGLTPLQIMKLVYLCHGFKLGLTGKPLVEEDMLAWQYGPVVRSIYKYLPYGRVPVREPIADGMEADFSDDETSIMDQVFDKYGGFDGIYLSSLTHQPGTPWDKTWKRFGKNAVIPQDLIEEHFGQLVGRTT